MTEPIPFSDVIKIVDKFNTCIQDEQLHFQASNFPTMNDMYLLYLLENKNPTDILIGSVKHYDDHFKIQLKHNYNYKVKLKPVLDTEKNCFNGFINVFNDNISLINNIEIDDIEMMDTFNETNVLSSFKDFKLIYDTNIFFNKNENLPYISHTLSLLSLKSNKNLFSVDICEVVRHSNIDFSFRVINNFFKNYYFQPYVNKVVSQMTPEEKTIIKMLYI